MKNFLIQFGILLIFVVCGGAWAVYTSETLTLENVSIVQFLLGGVRFAYTASIWYSILLLSKVVIIPMISGFISIWAAIITLFGGLLINWGLITRRFLICMGLSLISTGQERSIIFGAGALAIAMLWILVKYTRLQKDRDALVVQNNVDKKADAILSADAIIIKMKGFTDIQPTFIETVSTIKACLDSGKDIPALEKAKIHKMYYHFESLARRLKNKKSKESVICLEICEDIEKVYYAI